MSRSLTDIVVIGGGPGGYVAALRAAQLGGSVVLVEKDSVGGSCLNRGCIPTKALVASVEMLAGCREAASFGVEVGLPSADFSRMMARKNEIVAQMVEGVTFLLQRAGVSTLRGLGAVVEPGLVEVRDSDGAVERVRTKAIIIATGSEPAELPGLRPDGETVLNSTQVLQLGEAPRSLVVVGAGAIGLEFATIFNALGTQVTVVEMLPQVLPNEDKEIADLLEKALVAKGIKVITGVGVERANLQDGEMVLQVSSGESLRAAKALVAVGRALNTQGIGLERIGIALDARAIKVNQRMETTVPSVYAVGDVVGGWLLAHVAMREGIVAAQNAMGMRSKMDYRVVPRTVWTLPEVASVGLTEQQARQAGLSVKVGRFPFPGLAKAVAVGQTNGLVKLVGDARTDELLGAHMIGPCVTELIAEVSTAMKLETTVEELAGAVHAHPTLSEAIMEAASALRGHPIHF